MRLFLAILALALAVSAYTVPESAKVCSTDSDCTFIDTNCPGVCGCNFQTVSTSSLSATQDALLKSCPAVTGPVCMIACASPVAPSCSKSSTSSTGICTFGSIVIDPLPTSTCDLRTNCQGIQNMCVNSKTPVMDCAAPIEPVPLLPVAKRDAELSIAYTCEDMCLNKAQCAQTPGTVDGCSFQNSATAPLDGITYDQCVAKCNTVTSGIKLEGECTALYGCNPLVNDRCTANIFDSILCAEPTGDYSLTCAEQCLERADCKQTPGTAATPKQCSFQDSTTAPADGVTYTKCLTNCQTAGCPNGNAPAKCAVDPCLGKTCPNRPTGAVCKANFCNGCNDIAFYVNGVEVDCDPKLSPCTGLPCGICLANSDCTFCSGSVASYCSSKNSIFAEYCVAKASGATVSSATTCPVTGGETTGPKTEVTDSTDFQAAIAASVEPILQKITVVITFIVKEAATAASNGFEILKLFVDISGTPTDQDKIDVCELIRKTAISRDSKIPTDKLVCSLLPAPATQVKRDALQSSQYVAQLTYPTNTQSAGAVSVFASLSAVLAAVVALLF